MRTDVRDVKAPVRCLKVHAPQWIAQAILKSAHGTQKASFGLPCSIAKS